MTPLVLIAVFTQRGEAGGLLLFALIGVGLSLVGGLGSWLRFRYWVAGDELRVHSGLLVQRRVFIPRSRIQGFDVSAGVLQRLFGLVRVEVRTAAAGTQIELSAVTSAEARRLKGHLCPELVEEAGGGGSPVFAGTAAHRFTLSRRDLLLAGATSGSFGVILSALGWLYAKLEDVLAERLVDGLLEFSRAGRGFLDHPARLALAVAGLLSAAFVVSVLAQMARYGGFAVERRNNSLVMERGLFERREVSISVERIQAIRIVEGVLREPLGYATLFVESAGHAEEKGQSMVLHPFLHRSRWAEVLGVLAPEFSVVTSLERPPPRAALRFFLRPVLVTLAAAVGATVLWPQGPIVFLLLIPAGWIAWRTYRDTGFALHGCVAVLRSRGLARVTVIVPRRRVEYATVLTGPLQRRKGIASLQVGVAAGGGGLAVAVRDLDVQVCQALIDWLGLNICGDSGGSLPRIEESGPRR